MPWGVKLALEGQGIAFWMQQLCKIAGHKKVDVIQTWTQQRGTVGNIALKCSHQRRACCSFPNSPDVYFLSDGSDKSPLYI
jgi:hypothetical protein